MAKRIVLGVIVLLLAVILLALLWLKLHSSGRPPALLDGDGNEIPGSVNEKVFMDVNGQRQGMFIRGEAADKPVLLFLHGGPGSPELAMGIGEDGDPRLEQEFVVCYWDQRGAGMSYTSDLNPDTLTLEQMIDDTLEVTRYLQERFGQEKIYLMGHSWGSYLGIKTIERNPEPYYLFMGVGQVTRQYESEKLAYIYMLEHAREIGDDKAVKDLEKFDVNANDFPQQDYIRSVRTTLMNKYGIGVTHSGASMLEMSMSVLKFSGYTMGEKIGYLRGMDLALNRLFDVITHDDLFISSPSFQIPVYVLHGAYDYQVSQTLAEEYVAHIEAPDKGFYLFENSAHSPIWEEPAPFMAAVREIVER